MYCTVYWILNADRCTSMHWFVNKVSEILYFALTRFNIMKLTVPLIIVFFLLTMNVIGWFSHSHFGLFDRNFCRVVSCRVVSCCRVVFLIIIMSTTVLRCRTACVCPCRSFLLISTHTTYPLSKFTLGLGWLLITSLNWKFISFYDGINDNANLLTLLQYAGEYAVLFLLLITWKSSLMPTSWTECTVQ